MKTIFIWITLKPVLGFNNHFNYREFKRNSSILVSYYFPQILKRMSSSLLNAFLMIKEQYPE